MATPACGARTSLFCKKGKSAFVRSHPSSSASSVLPQGEYRRLLNSATLSAGRHSPPPPAPPHDKHAGVLPNHVECQQAQCKGSAVDPKCETSRLLVAANCCATGNYTSSSISERMRARQKASRQKQRDDLRREKEREEEMRDAQEEEICMSKRRETILRAQSLLRRDQGCYRELNTALMTSDVIAGREQQSRWKEEARKMENLRGKHYADVQAQMEDHQKQREAQKATATKERLDRLKRAQDKQLEDFRQRRREEAAELVRTRQAFQEEVQAEMQREEGEQQEKRKLQRQRASELTEENAALQEAKKEAAARQKAEEVAIEATARRQEHVREMIKARVAEVERKKLEGRVRLVERQSKQLAAAAEKEASHVERAVRDAREKEEQRAMEKTEEQRRTMELIDGQRQEQLRMQQERRQMEEDAAKRLADELREKADKARCAEDAKRFAKRKEAEELAVFLQEQVAYKEEREKRQMEEERTEARRLTQLHNSELHEFEHFARECIDAARKLNRDPKPLEKTLQRYREDKRTGNARKQSHDAN